MNSTSHRLLRGLASATAALALLALGGAPPATAQPEPTPRPGVGTLPTAAPRAVVPPVIKPGADKRRIKGPRRGLTPTRDVVRTEGNRPGVMDTGGRKKSFDPKVNDERPAKAAGGAKGSDAAPSEGLPTKVEDVIEWKSNFEQGIKCKRLPLNARIRLDFNEISLGDLTKFISCITEQNFILTGGANKNATVSILSPKPVTAYEAYKAYLSALQANGLTIVPNGSFLEIVPAGESKTQGGPIYGIGRRGPNTDQMITRLVQLDHVQAEEILPVMDKFRTKSADITVYAPTNTIIITDTGANIRRLLKLVKDLDVPIGKERIWIRPVVNTSASEIASLLGSIIGDSGGKATTSKSTRKTTRKTSKQGRKKSPSATGGSSVIGGGDPSNISVSKMIPDDRTNSLIFVATRTAYLQVDRIIRRLDVAIPGEGGFHVHALENADAEEVAQTLQSLAQGSRSGGGARRTTGSSSSAVKGASTAAGLFEGEVKITAYKPTNSLLIESSLQDYVVIRRVIKELDVRRKQVYVEAIIMEVSTNKDRSFDLSGSAGTTFKVDGEELPLIMGSGGLGLDVSGALSTLEAGGGAIGLQGPLVDVAAGSDGGTFSVAAFGFTMRALQTTSDVNVLSTPHILTLENEEAEIQVGKRQPYVTTSAGLGGLSSLSRLPGLAGGAAASGLGALGGLGGLGGLGSLGGLGRNFQYVDVDLTLKIKPQVNDSGFVRLEIDQQLDDIEGFVGGGASDGGAPVTSKRKVNNVVVVRDGQPVVVGGLMRDKETESVQKVPFLGDIPLIGLLFRRTSTQVEKSNLLMIIIPHVIRDPSDLKRIYEQRREEYRELARVMAERRKEYEGELDYRKKSGILHDIHVTIEKARTDRELRERAVFEATEVDTVGPPETHDIEYDPRRAVGRRDKRHEEREERGDR